MATVNLNLCFPLSKSGTRSPLPKQQTFISLVMDPKGPKYVAYYGGVGSGKSLILCISMLMQAVVYGGEYVIARQFMPELRRTTMKQFLEICPKELIIEHRIADAEIHLKAANGKKAIVYFVGLDEPGKLRSLNLSGYGIDEASQVSEESFLLLQGRLRNPNGLRKGLMVGNPAGHNWVYHYFVKQDMFKSEMAKRDFRLILAPSTENVHLPDEYIKSMQETYTKERWEREVMGSFDSFSGQIYTEFRRDVHVIKPFAIPKEWTRIIGADHGFVNPAAAVWGAVDYDGNIYIYREFYESGWLIEEICKGHKTTREPGIAVLSSREKIDGMYLDPSTKRGVGQTGSSDWDVYLEHMPRKIPIIPAQNAVEAGIDRVKSYLKINERTGKPRLYIFDTCTNLIETLVTYQWAELPDNQKGIKNPKEEPKKHNDHLPDALRYLCMSRPETPILTSKREQLDNDFSLEGSIRRELYDIKNPNPKDPYKDL